MNFSSSHADTGFFTVLPHIVTNNQWKPVQSVRWWRLLATKTDANDLAKYKNLGTPQTGHHKKQKEKRSIGWEQGAPDF